jgi:hypothetical protein
MAISRMSVLALSTKYDCKIAQILMTTEYTEQGLLLGSDTNGAIPSDNESELDETTAAAGKNSNASRT